ncbi:hypothetical protein P171DRAFT_161373 [Karstenula rhodostoma CBS 690.94]|uniref:Uncharacterized protein n=1 Tax=Karstenula rhodostoma CBS 690.94 TaxID=1392251 RepID=A0A9P4P7U8_9PLEO|nr:hypothetical protein P171DRAFT_161373 [Karstenula rhodostoma CBS 690.94]
MYLPPFGCLPSQYQHFGGLLLLLCFFPRVTWTTFLFVNFRLFVCRTSMVRKSISLVLGNFFFIAFSSFRSFSFHWAPTYSMSTRSTGLTQHSSPILSPSVLHLAAHIPFAK